jgi:hypothetical protein
MARKPVRDTRGTQKGPQQHAEGQHGEKTHERFIERLQEGPHDESPDRTREHDRDLARHSHRGDDQRRPPGGPREK